MTIFQIVFISLFGSLAIHAILNVLSQRESRRKYFFRGGLWLAITLVIAAPKLTTYFASIFGIGRGSDLVFYAAIFIGIWACLFFYNRCRTLEIAITSLVRADALANAARGGREHVVELHSEAGRHSVTRESPTAEPRKNFTLSGHK